VIADAIFRGREGDLSSLDLELLDISIDRCVHDEILLIV